MRFGEVSRELFKCLCADIPRIDADLPRKPRARRLDCLWLTIGRRHEIGIFRKIAENAIDVARRGECLVHDRHPAAAERHEPQPCHQEAAHDAGIDQFAMRHARRVAIALRRDLTVLQRNDIGRRRAHIDEERLADMSGDEAPRSRANLRKRSWLTFFAAASAATNPAGSGIKSRSAERRARAAAEIAATPTLRSAKASDNSPVIVATLSSAGPSARLGLGKGAMQLIDTQPERQAICTTSTIMPAFEPRGFQMRAANVPADDALHVDLALQ